LYRVESYGDGFSSSALIGGVSQYEAIQISLIPYWFDF
jgi:hypothetical protein